MDSKRDDGVSENVKLAESFRAAFAIWNSARAPKLHNSKGNSPAKTREPPSLVDEVAVSEEPSAAQAGPKLENEWVKPFFQLSIQNITVSEKPGAEKADLTPEGELAKHWLPLSMLNAAEPEELSAAKAGFKLEVELFKQWLPLSIQNVAVSEGLDADQVDLKQKDEPAKPCLPFSIQNVPVSEELDAQQADQKPKNAPVKPCLPLSIQNVTRNLAEVEEKEQKHFLSKTDKPYLLTPSDLHNIAFEERMTAWVDNANHELSKENEDITPDQDASVYSYGLRALSIADLPSEDDDQEKERASSTELNPYLVERSQRAEAAEERITSLTHKRKSRCIKPGIGLYLRHATREDDQALAAIYNSYVRVTVQCLDTEQITVEDMRHRIDESRRRELPFIVAICEEPGRRSWGEILGYVRLTNFMDGQPSVSTTAQLEIMVSQRHKGQNVGRCLMDAMLTFADPNYAPRGGYFFVAKPEGLTDSGSVSCRPLSHLVMSMSHDCSEVSRYQRIRAWLEKEHKFREEGYLRSVAQKMSQRVNIALLVRVILQ